MKKKIGQFIFDLVVKYINYLDDENYDRLLARVHRFEFARKRPLPKCDGKIMMFNYHSISNVKDKQ